MDFRQLQHFCSLIQHGSFTTAAMHLQIAQPALSQSLKKLETEFNVKLVNRSAGKSDKSISLTAEGEALYQHAKIILGQMEQAEHHIRSMASLSMGEVRIAVPGMLGSFYLPRRLMAFRHLHDNIKLSLFEGGTRDTLRMLNQEEVDIAIITGHDMQDHFDGHFLLQEQMVAAVGWDHPLAEHSSLSLSQFLQHDLVMFKTGYFHREWLLAQAKLLDITPKIAFETNLINLIKQLVSQGFAISSVLNMAVNQEDKIHPIPFDPPISLDLYIAWKKGKPLSSADTAFVEFLLNNAT
ncbi:LysR family transcriptional regulator [Shewanella sp. NIFS-20-20]|uniref:LysR family transcriptional regulator n=1 Tax=Shewanella sp. NIFS-20-20 TaxID=2853806 RepID=UPI001C4443B7|nr:LysR family transcriptional regulator [Shewanella sp. NIFS-20-20]MBV7314863.1 LysR family transcriptional regulator [Shewanella sp. NIFS-20-20]